MFIYLNFQQLNLAAAIAYNQQDEANIKIAELERQLSEAKVKCLDTEQLLENYQRDAHVILQIGNFIVDFTSYVDFADEHSGNCQNQRRLQGKRKKAEWENSNTDFWQS